MLQAHMIGVAEQIGAYSDAIEIAPHARWLFTSGTPGMALDGRLPADMTGQADLAWQHIVTMLEKARMGVQDLVRPGFLLEIEAVAAAV